MGFRTCKKCGAELDREVLKHNFFKCTKCGNYLRVHVVYRLAEITDEGSFREWDRDVKLEHSEDLDEDYSNKLKGMMAKHQLNEAVMTGEATIHGQHTAIGVMDSRFMMASMGYVVGEKITRLFDRAIKKKLPVILFCCSGGARMQEGMISLMQMAKTAAAVKRHSDAGLLYISVLTNPTMGGVTASFATIADIILAEKGAMIGFAGQRVIEQNTGEKLPAGFQTAEFQKEHGFVDMVVERETLKETLGKLLTIHGQKPKKVLFGLGKLVKPGVPKKDPEVKKWDRLMVARSQKRPTSLDFIERICDDFIELAGDRAVGDDHAIVAGLAEIAGYYVTVIGQQKGKKGFEDAMFRNWGMPSPSGYRKSLRLMKQAEKFGRPIICFVDTIGASCGIKAEEQGQGSLIAELLKEMSTIQVPILSIVISEGGSGGALALAVANEVWMLENAAYSILTPEGYATILWKDHTKAPDAAELMQMDAFELHEAKVVEQIIPEKEPITMDNVDSICPGLKAGILEFMLRNCSKSAKTLINDRFKRFRQY